MEILSNVWSIVLVACGFGLLMFVHELGHFLAARRFGIPVEAFSLGIGPALLSMKRGETLYTIRPFPFFAYVLLSGMDPDSESFEDPKGFNRQPWYAKAIVLVAGATFNFLLAVLLYACMGLGWGYGVPQLADVKQDLPAYKAGLRSGDMLLSVEGVRVTNASEVQRSIQESLEGGLHPLNVRYLRDGESNSINVTPEARRTLDLDLAELNPGMVGMVIPGGVADEAGIRPGDILVSLDGEPVTDSNQLDLLLNSPGAQPPFNLVVERDGEEMRMEITPDKSYMLGVTLVQATTNRVSAVASRQMNHVVGIEPGSPIAESGLMNYDRLVSISMKTDGPSVPITADPFRGDIDALARALDQKGAFSRPVEITVERAGEFRTITHTFRYEGGAPALGFHFFHFLADSGIQARDVVRKIDGRPVEHGMLSMIEALEGAQGRPVEIEIERGGEILTLRHTFNFANGRPDLWDIRFFRRLVKVGPLTALDAGWDHSVSFFGRILVFLGRLISRGEGVEDLGGPVAILGVSFQAAKTGIYILMEFLVMLNINLALINLLPFPALDGGRLVFVFLNALTPKKRLISPRVENVFHTVGFVALLGLALLITIGDFQKLDMILGG